MGHPTFRRNRPPRRYRALRGRCCEGLADPSQSSPGADIEDFQLRDRRRSHRRQSLCAIEEALEEVRATRVLTDDEIRLFWRRIAEPPNSARIGQALRLVLLTAVRVSELAGAEFREFDRMDDVDGATWTISASRSKNSRAHMIPLSKPALNIVLDLVKRAEKPSVHDAKRQFLLRSPARADKPIDGHALSVAMMRFGNALNALSTKQHLGDEERRAIESWTAERPTAHDLRRTLATRLAGLGVPAEDISACLNHTRKGVTATHYDHYDRAREKRRALALWGQRVAELVSGAPSPARLRIGLRTDARRDAIQGGDRSPNVSMTVRLPHSRVGKGGRSIPP